MFKRILYILIFAGLSLAFTSSYTNEKPFVVVLDAGHGGHDSGNRGNGYFEKNIALDIILKTGKILEQQPNIKVIYTRKTDVFIPLNKRADIANNAKADLFVSVHCNAHKSAAKGTETFVLGLHANQRNFNVAKQENAVILLEDDYETNYEGFDPNSPESVIGLTLMQEEYLEQSLSLASKVQESFTHQLKRENRGVKQAGFLVLHRTFMPSVLIETGFLTNKSEGKYLNSTQGKTALANSIAKAILKYQAETNSSFSVDFDEPNIIVEEKTVKKTVPETEIKKEEPKSETPKTVSEIIFKVQIGSSTWDLDLKPSNFKGLKNLSKEESNGVFKYFYASETSIDEANKAKANAIEKGFDSCFLVAFKDGKKIPISQAIK